MSQESPTASSPVAAAPAPPPVSAGLKLVLFGMPAAGKSSLLGALAQAADTQAGTLRAALVDHSGGLKDLRRRLYEGQPVRTNDEVVAYPITLKSVPQSDGSRGPADQQVTLIDCDGQIVNSMLARQTLEGTGKGELARSVLEADALILVVDVSIPDNLKKDFAQFARFLRVLEQSRSARNEINGLPVYLVLTKCDLLAREKDTTSSWIDRIEETKRQVDRKFREFLAQQAAREQQPFGKIALNVWATATGRPALSGTEARSKDPYGVAELFRLTVDAAREFRAVRGAASARLGLAIFGIGAFFGVLLLVGLLFLTFRPGAEVSELESEVRALRTAWSETTTERFYKPAEKIKQLRSIKDRPDFLNLPPELRDYVEKTRKEIDAYLAYELEFKEKVTNPSEPRFARNEAELDKIEMTLKELPIPADYEAGWRDTRIAKLRERLVGEAAQFRLAIAQTAQQYEKLLEKAKKLDKTKMLAVDYDRERDALLAESRRLQALFKEEKRPREFPFLTYDDLARFERIRELREAWEQKEAELRK